MGYDASAVMIIGVRYNRGELDTSLYIRNRERNCDHDVKGSTRYCPECGKHVFRDTSQPVEGYDQDNETVFGLKRVYCDHTDWEFIAYHVVRMGSGLIESIDSRAVPLPEIRETVRKKLEPLGLFHENDFGLHVFLEESV